MTTPKQNKIKSQPPATVQNFPIVGIGASAGGLDAFKRLLGAIPESSGMAFVLVQHLDPSHESILPEILQRVTKLPVYEITEDIHLAPDHIYIIPSNKILTSTDGVLQLAPREKKILNFSIDIFFTSLADVHKEFAVGVVLSGTGSDGTLGLKAIKDHGGISIAQDSESATYDSMPQSAVNSGVVDFILAPEKIPAHLLQINKTYESSHFFKGAEEELPKDDEAIFKQILMLLRQRSGVDFTYYKQPTFHRRIARRIAIVKKKTLSEYLKILRSDKSEQDALFQDVLIPVTSFFRDPKIFQTLCETIFPSIIKNKAADEPIRIWIAGCSTGEEAFSIAICLHEFLEDKISNTKIQIFASDISEKAIKKARAAIYSKADVENISETQLKNYFVKNNGGYEVNKIIRDICVFATHNFLKDPPFAKMDLICCRNVLIYMDTFLQKKAFTTFHYALRENGFLVLGKSETTGASSDLFTQISKQDKIYSRKPLPGRFMHVATDRKEESFATKYKSADREEPTQTDYRKSAEQIMLSKAPASVVVNEQMDIVHIHGDITPFLAAPQGKPTHNLIKMAREGLAFELRNAIHKASKEEDTVIKKNIPVRTNSRLNTDGGQGNQTLVAIEIIPLMDTVEPHYLIRFEKKNLDVQEENKSVSVSINATRKQNQQLEKELSQTREDMRFITEDMEAANEELQSANEELQSSNEEMQSLNEELETSKEELQSTNEELIIVNQELLDKHEQLNASRYYAESIITTLREPLIVLDKALRIKTANASFYKKFNAEEQETEGKLFYEIQNGQWDDYEMRRLLENILPKQERLTDFEINLKFPSIGVRHIHLNARQIINKKSNEQLILLAIEDVTEAASAYKKIEESEQFNRTILENSPDCFKVLDDEGRIQYMNFNGLCQMEIDDFSTVKNKDWWSMWGIENQALIKTSIEDALKGETAHFTALCPTAKGTQKWWDVVIAPVGRVGESVKQVISVSRDITKQRESEEAIEKIASQLTLATDSANIGIWSLDIRSSKLEWSDIHKRMWGYDEHREDLRYEDWHKLILSEDKERAFQQIEESKINHSIYEVDYRISREKDGVIVWIKSIGKYQYDEFGIACKLTGISVDVTEQKSFTEELEIQVKERTNELQTANEELKRTNLQLDQFAFVASHDLQEPLRKILTFTQRLQEKHNAELSAEGKSYLNKIDDASNRMTTLIHDLLNFSRLLQPEKSFKETNLNETLKNIVTDFDLVITEKKAKIKIGILPSIEAIPFQMNQLIYNLVSNALKYSSEELPSLITITSRKLSQKEIKKYPALNPLIAHIELIFKDNGIGFRQQYAEKIFTIFQRLHSKETYMGTGIGLALCKRIVENHHGEIFANAEENQGASFHVLLPIKQSR